MFKNTHDPRIGRHLVPYLLLTLFPATASAGGLVIDYGQYAEESQAALSPLSRLDVSLDLLEDAMTVVEGRTYRVDGFSILDQEIGSTTARFYRTVPSESAIISLRVGSETVAGRILSPAEADQVRLEVFSETNEPGPLREFGQPLFVSDPFPVDLYSYSNGVSLEMTVSRLLEAHDTLRATTLPIDWSHVPVSSVTVAVSAETDAELRALYSPFHGLSVLRDGLYEASATYVGRDVATSLPLTVMVSSSNEPIHLDLMPFREDAEEGGYLMALLTPSARVGEAEEALPRDLVFVVDTSGSMAGDKMRQAKDALSEVLAQLSPTDTFGIVRFDSTVDTFTDTAVLASPSRVSAAQGFVSEMVADGGTNLYDAIERGFSVLPTEPGHLRYIVLLTDGVPTEGETGIEGILAMANRRNEVGARLFAFGIGDDVNTVLLDRLAIDSRGDVFYIRSNAGVSDAVTEFFSGIAAPALVDPVLDLSGFGLSEVYPSGLPDLFAGETTMLIGRYNQPGRQQVALVGEGTDGTEATLFDVSLPAYASHNPHVPRVWATRHVGHLFQEVKLGDDDPAIVDEAMRIARRYGVLTEFTRYQRNVEGNIELVYMGVPDDDVGDQAVSTSGSLDEYQNSGSVGDSGDDSEPDPGDIGQMAQPDVADAPRQNNPFGDVRYHADRSLPSVDGWYSDTKLPLGPDWVDLHFGSAMYLDFLESEGADGAGAFLSLGRNLRFEFLGRAIRVTDAMDTVALQTPDESAEIPVAREVSNELAQVDVLDHMTGAQAEQLANEVRGFDDVVDPSGCGCQTGVRGGQTTPYAALLALCVLGAGLGRRRRRSL